MPATGPTPLMTAEELEHYPDRGKQVELIRGHLLVREPPGTLHGIVAGNLTGFLGDFVRKNRLGVVSAQDTGFKIASNPDTVRAPDVGFISRDRLGDVKARGYAALAPDLVVEVLSPDDRPAEVLAKVADWLAGGTRLVWVIDPARAQATIHREDGTIALIPPDGVLEGDDVLPGFTCLLADALRLG
jgi:Uma2 family endonuclease